MACFNLCHLGKLQLSSQYLKINILWKRIYIFVLVVIIGHDIKLFVEISQQVHLSPIPVLPLCIVIISKLIRILKIHVRNSSVCLVIKGKQNWVCLVCTWHQDIKWLTGNKFHYAINLTPNTQCLPTYTHNLVTLDYLWNKMG